MTRRTCGFGHGPRFATPLNNERNKSPEPGAYVLKSDFAKPGTSASRRDKGHMYSFGCPHEKYRKVYVPGCKICHDSDAIPGPGHYTNTHNTMGTEGKSFLLKGKMTHFADPAVLRRKADVPGPGLYGSPLELNKMGVYVLSTVENSRATKWSPSKTRFVDNDYYRRNTPGPGNYNPSDYDSSTGMYITSKFRNRGSIQYRHDITKKVERATTETPGPGSYIAPSDFGHLDLRP